MDRLETLTEECINDLIQTLSSQILNVTSESGDDNGRYINLFVESDDAVGAWDAMKTSLLADSMVGNEIRTAAIVTMTGRNGWDDYLLLHHFDPIQQLDTIQDMG